MNMQRLFASSPGFLALASGRAALWSDRETRAAGSRAVSSGLHGEIFAVASGFAGRSTLPDEKLTFAKMHTAVYDVPAVTGARTD